MMVETLYTPLLFSVCAVAWQRITEPGEVFGWLPPLLFKRQYLSDTANKIQYAIARVTWACSKCIAGFWCFWYTVLLVFTHTHSFDVSMLPAPLIAVAGALAFERLLQE